MGWDPNQPPPLIQTLSTPKCYVPPHLSLVGTGPPHHRICIDNPACKYLPTPLRCILHTYNIMVVTARHLFHCMLRMDSLQAVNTTMSAVNLNRYTICSLVWSQTLVIYYLIFDVVIILDTRSGCMIKQKYKIAQKLRGI